MRHDVLNGGSVTEASGEFGDALATGLGWFSLGLGSAELLEPRLVTRSLEMEGSESLVRLDGLREIAVGAAILGTSGSARAPWLWARVAGDLLDIGTVGGARHDPGTHKGTIGAALAALTGVTLVDAYCASRLSPGRPEPRIRLAPQAQLPRPSDFIPYSEAVEQRLPDEDEIIDAIIAVMDKGGEAVRDRGTRLSHVACGGAWIAAG